MRIAVRARVAGKMPPAIVAPTQKRRQLRAGAAFPPQRRRNRDSGVGHETPSDADRGVGNERLVMRQPHRVSVWPTASTIADVVSFAASYFTWSRRSTRQQ